MNGHCNETEFCVKKKEQKPKKTQTNSTVVVPHLRAKSRAQHPVHINFSLHTMFKPLSKSLLFFFIH